MSGEELTVRLRDASGKQLPVAEVYLELRFYTGGHFRYAFSLGRTDSHGVCRATFESIKEQLEANRRSSLMDYNTPLTECDTTVGILAPTATELVERDVARAKWWPEEHSRYADAANDRVRCPEQKFELRRENDNMFELMCETEES